MSQTARKTASSRPNGRVIIYAALSLVVVAVIVAIGLLNRSSVPNAASNAPIQANLKVGDTAPPFSVKTNAGPFELSAVSSPVLLEVFATWCPHCQRETPVLNQIAAKYQGKIAMVAVSGSPNAINGNDPESQADVNAFGQQFDVRYPIAYDPTLDVAQKYLKNGFPTLVMIDRNKKVVWMTSGETAQAEIEKAIKMTL
ncbi:hypothetical protein WPS_22100 [Vulcanimicrobium alpinum]|uniref:Thioredoxin domain-containing protein n=1 Tax=Vulcanimicrobium alpinum TaxID=3016050 RepID=A0AAN1XX26_UNVUL|nr:TlpA disulfide reductase family protein [Vulcanimicrobium alpinum]BDE06934.1 hypothetical protein WPS_22100 [Vulcanimicrobium alpinum]